MAGPAFGTWDSTNQLGARNPWRAVIAASPDAAPAPASGSRAVAPALLQARPRAFNLYDHSELNHPVTVCLAFG
jgi:hypothetical protein